MAACDMKPQEASELSCRGWHHGILQSLHRKINKLRLTAMPQSGMPSGSSSANRSTCAPAGTHTAGDGAEALLACGVPYLQLDPFAIDQHLLDLEINTAVGAKRVSVSRVEAGKGGLPKAAPPPPHPIVVMKLDVKLSSAKRSSRQLFPTPAHKGTGLFEQKQVPAAWITRL